MSQFIPYMLLAGTYIHSASAAYNLIQDHSGDKFFDGFNFFSGKDPTHGFVQYLPQGDAEQKGLYSVQGDSKKAYVGVDFTNPAPNGRSSVRLESKASIGPSLVIADFDHMPGGICGTWPAFWLVGPDWPSGGEIDIVEGVNEQTQNSMTLHTGAGLRVGSNAAAFSGNMITKNCDVKAPDQADNSGCSIQDNDPASYGSGFNDANGGVYATQWTDDFIKIWHFPRNKIPQDINAGNPVPGDSWGKPSASFMASNKNYFSQQKIVLDTTFCGDWAGSPNVWQQSSCGKKASTCNAYVRDNPADFKDAYWLINSIQVFQDNGSPTNSSASDSTSSTRSIVSTPTPSGFSSTESVHHSGRTRTKTATVTVTLPPTPTTTAPDQNQTPSSQSGGRRTRTRTKTVTATSNQVDARSQTTSTPVAHGHRNHTNIRVPIPRWFRPRQ